MDAKEIELFELLKVEYAQGRVTKPTMSRCQPIYNFYTHKGVKNCMCSKVGRTILAKEFLTWYESRT